MNSLKAAIDKLDFQKSKITKDDGDFLLGVFAPNDADAEMLKSQGLKTFYVQNGVENNTTGDSVRGIVDIAGGFGYALGVSNNDTHWFKSFISGKANPWHRLITEEETKAFQRQKIFKDNDFTLATCPKGTDFGDFLKSNSVPVGFSIIRDNNTARNAMVIKENNNYIYAYSGGQSNDFERFSINKGVASGWIRSLNTNDIVCAKLTPTGGATDPCVMTVIGETLVNLQFNGRYPTKGGQAIYWIDAKYAPKTGVSFALPHNNIEGTQLVISIGSNGAVVLVANSDDVSTAFGSYTYDCKV